MGAVFKREFKSYMCSIYGIAYISVMLLLTGVFFFLYNLMYAEPQIEIFLSDFCMILLAAIPLLWLRCAREGSKNGADIFMRSLPLKPSQTVLGKYLALLSVFAIPSLMLCVLPLLLSFSGKVIFAASYTSILAYLLAGAALLALCTFINSLIKKPWLAAALSFTAELILLVISIFGDKLPRAVSFISPFYGFEDLSYGIFDWSKVLYLLSFAVIFILLSVCVTANKRSHRLIFAAVIAAILAINLIIFALPSVYTTADTTQNKNISVSKETRDFLKDIDREATIYYTCENGETDPALEALLQRFTDMNPKLDYAVIDTVSQPDFVSRYTENELNGHSLIVESELRYYVIDFYDLYYVLNQYTGQISYYTFLEYTQGELSEYSSYFTSENTFLYFNGESVLVTALDYVTADDLQCIYLLNNHGETELDKDIYLLPFSSATIAYSELGSAASIPANCACLIINDPASDLTAAEADSIIRYLDAGGAMILTTSPGANNFTQLMRVMEHYGVTAEAGTVCETTSGNYYSGIKSQLLPIMNQNYDITSFLIEQNGYSSSEVTLLMPESHGIKAVGGASSNLTLTAIAKTTPNAYITSNGSKTEGSEGEKIVGVAIDKTVGNTSTNIVWYASAKAFERSTVEKRFVNSTYLFLTVSYAGNEAQFSSETASKIEARVQNSQSFKMTSDRAIILGIITAVAIPAATLLTGIAVLGKRKKK